MARLTLADIRDYVDSFGVADTVYMGMMDPKPERSFGVYHSKHTHQYQTVLGGPEDETYDITYITILVHWSQSPRETYEAGSQIYDAIRADRNARVNDAEIWFTMPIYSLQDIGADEGGVHEMVMEAAVYSAR